ncbi:MAG TPA: hypothetical protein VJ963_06845 [Bacteroidales bacterium]|nr:hypothetical protein [Bacteroidales bacterium]
MMKKTEETEGKNPFKIPDNYFEEVNRKIISATAGYEPEVKKTGVYRRLRPYMAVAASVAVLVMLSFVALRLFQPEKTTQQVSEIIYSESTESYFDDIDISTIEQNAASIDIYDEVPDVSNQEIIDYLLLDNVEISDIYNQL